MVENKAVYKERPTELRIGLSRREFIDALVHNRRPAVDVYESLAYTVPGIVAHQSALKEGELLKVPQYNRAV